MSPDKRGDVQREYRLAELLGARVEEEGKSLVDEELGKVDLLEEGAKHGSGVLDCEEARRGARGQVALEQVPCAEAEGDDEASGGLRQLEPLRLALGIDEGMQGRFPLPSAARRGRGLRSSRRLIDEEGSGTASRSLSPRLWSERESASRLRRKTRSLMRRTSSRARKGRSRSVRRGPARLFGARPPTRMARLAAA